MSGNRPSDNLGNYGDSLLISRCKISEVLRRDCPTGSSEQVDEVAELHFPSGCATGKMPDTMDRIHA